MLSKYQFIPRTTQLGEGSYGIVYPAENIITKEKVAIKEMSILQGCFYDAKSIFREISLLRTLKGHPNIVSLEYIEMSTTETKNTIYLVFKLYETSLYKVIVSAQELTTRHLQYIMHQIIDAINYMHTAGMAHRDLKPDNILINSNCSIAICDLGLARSIQLISDTKDVHPEPLNNLSTYVVTRWYRSPELLLSCCTDGFAIDMWSIGCILAQLFLRSPLFYGETSLEVLYLINEVIGITNGPEYNWYATGTVFSNSRTKTFQDIFKTLDSDARDLLSKMLEVNPLARIKAAQALLHTFLRSLQETEVNLTFDLKSISVQDRCCLNNYYQFERDLERAEVSSSVIPESELFNSTFDLIVNEVKQYDSITTTQDSAESSSITSHADTESDKDPATLAPSSIANTATFFQTHTTTHENSEQKKPDSASTTAGLGNT